MFLDVTFPGHEITALAAEDIDTTEIIATVNGRESRNSSQRKLRRRYDLSAIEITRDQAQSIYDFFHVVGGRKRSFRFRDYRHFAVTSGNIGTGDGATTTFQLRSAHTFGGVTVYRDETKPRATPAIYVNAVLQSSGVSTSLATGLATFTVAPAAAAVITATFEFDVCARFEQERLHWIATHAGGTNGGQIIEFDALSVIEVFGE